MMHPKDQVGPNAWPAGGGAGGRQQALPPRTDRLAEPDGTDVAAVEHLRNVALVAHVDHGKTTLIDQLLQQSGTLQRRGPKPSRVLDSDELERERGITILAKTTAVRWGRYRINIVDTPGHADFGGEVERVLSMVDSVLLLVDAVEGPMPQTRFVTQKAFALGLCPIVVINKVDRVDARPDWVLDQTFDLFDRLGATEEQLDFTTVYASALGGYAGLDPHVRIGDMTALFQTIVTQVPPPRVDPKGPLQLQITTLDYSPYVGVIGIGRVQRGVVRANSTVVVVGADGARRDGRVLQVLSSLGLERNEVTAACAGDIVAITGIEGLRISETVCAPGTAEPLPALTLDKPTVSMTLQVNDSPLAGREGQYVTSRQLRERLDRELLHNVALRAEATDDPDRFRVSGRGELHLSVLIENMRRDGYELAVSRPEAIVRVIDGAPSEPYEELTVEVELVHQGVVMQRLGERAAELRNLRPDGRGRIRLDYVIPARGLIGFQGEFRTLTSGSGILHHVFAHYAPLAAASVVRRKNGVLVSNADGKTLAYALFNLQERGRLLVGPGETVYEGMLVGIHARANDLVVNPTRAKQLTNIRAAARDDNVVLTPAVRLSLEEALEFVADDELIEVTPRSLRLRKKSLREPARRRASRRQ